MRETFWDSLVRLLAFWLAPPRPPEASDVRLFAVGPVLDLRPLDDDDDLMDD